MPSYFHFSMALLVAFGLENSADLRAAGDQPPAEKRRVVCLDGTWEIAEGSLSQPLAKYAQTVPVPGLADMADPPFEEVGSRPDDPRKRDLVLRDPRREAFWYRRFFSIDGPVPSVALLKIRKAKFGTSVYLNGQHVDNHLPCFTPGHFDLRPLLRGDGQKNELVIRVGAAPVQLPSHVPYGRDSEKVLYLPGIYDSVELILSGTPHVVNVQTAPDIEAKAVRVIATLRNSGIAAMSTKMTLTVREAQSGKTSIKFRLPEATTLQGGESRIVDVTVPIPDCRLWSPEDPFLYRLTIDTGADTQTTRFGMRSF